MFGNAALGFLDELAASNERIRFAANKSCWESLVPPVVVYPCREGAIMTRKRHRQAAISDYSRILSRALDERDGYTRRHCDRVIELCGALGRACGVDRHDLRDLCLAAVLHDIGKIGIPDRVLLKPASLDDEEWTEMRSHPLRGEQLVSAIAVDGVAGIARAVRHHHENFDGSGYPDGLAGEEVPYLSRMIAVADGYDAMVVPRTYRPARGHEQAMAELDRWSGRKYDPYVLKCFGAMIEESSRRAPSF